MSNLLIFVILFILIQLISSGKILNYTITPANLVEEECDVDSSSYRFAIKCVITPPPIYDLEFDLNLASPKNTKARCYILDDVENEIKCAIDTLSCLIKKTNIEIQSEQVININDSLNNVGLTFSKSNINAISKVTCKSCFLFSNIYFLILAVLLLYLL